MNIEHIAIWTQQLEELREFYSIYFGAKANEKYRNPAKNFESYFLSFASGARLELMHRPHIPESIHTLQQYTGIAHIAFGVATMQEVDKKAEALREAGFPILSGPRKTGDGYYEFETLDPDGNRLEVSCLYGT